MGGSNDPALGQPTFEWMAQSASRAGLVLDASSGWSADSTSRVPVNRTAVLVDWIIDHLWGLVSQPRRTAVMQRSRYIRRRAVGMTGIHPTAPKL